MNGYTADSRGSVTAPVTIRGMKTPLFKKSRSISPWVEAPRLPSRLRYATGDNTEWRPPPPDASYDRMPVYGRFSRRRY